MKRSDVSAATKEELQEASRKLTRFFTIVAGLTEKQEVPNDLIEHLIASYDLMREELTKANKRLSEILSR